MPYFPPPDEKKKTEPEAVAEQPAQEAVPVEPEELATESEYEIDEPRIEKVIKEVHAGTAELTALKDAKRESMYSLIDTEKSLQESGVPKDKIGEHPNYIKKVVAKDKVYAAYDKAHKALGERVLTAIELPQTEQRPIKITTGAVLPSKELRVKVSAAASSMAKVVLTPEKFAPIPVNMNVPGKRASRTKAGIHVSMKDTKATYIHEMMHELETRDIDVRSRVREFLILRTKGTKLSKMYGDEYGYRDNFIDTYMGKVYRNDRKNHLGMPSNESAIYGTEVLSMWATNMYSTPQLRLKFIREDPQTFEFGLRVLQRDWKGADAILADLRKTAGSPPARKIVK